MKNNNLYFFTPLRLCENKKTVIVSVLLWLYAGLLLFVWFFSRFTPEEAVIVRIGAGFISDLIWIPAGIAVWAYAFVSLTTLTVRFIYKIPCKPAVFLSIISAVIFVVFFPNTAFRFLFLPLVFSALRLLKNLLKHRNILLAFFGYAPSLVIITVIFAYYGWQMVPSVKPRELKTDIRVMTYNIFGNASAQSRKESIETIRRERPDIVCCIEFNPRSDPAVIRRELGDIFPFSVSNRDEKSWRTGEFILSRYPVTLLSNNIIDSSNIILSEVNVEGIEVKLVTVHLTRIGQNGIPDSLRTFGQKARTVTELERINDGRKYDKVQSLYSFIEQFDEPTIICGDFNDTPNSRVYHLFDGRYIDAFSSKGWGLGDTFGESTIKKELDNSLFPGFLARDIIRIDHIFVSRHFKVLSAYMVEKAKGSDHKPVVAVVRLKK